MGFFESKYGFRVMQSFLQSVEGWINLHICHFGWLIKVWAQNVFGKMYEILKNVSKMKPNHNVDL